MRLVTMETIEIRECHDNVIPVVITDIAMPGIGGLELGASSGLTSKVREVLEAKR